MKAHKKNTSVLNSMSGYSEEMLALMPGHVYWKDKDGVLQGCNNILAETLGFSSRHEIVGKNDYDIAKKPEADAIRAKDFKVMELGVRQTDEEEFTLPNGEKAIYLTQRIPVENAKNKIIGLIGISFDITERKNIHDEQLNGMKMLAATLAHELRTPLAALKSAAIGINKITPSLIKAYEAAESNHLDIPHISPSKLKLLQDVIYSLEKKVDQSNLVIDMLLANIRDSGDKLENLEACSAKSCISKALSQYVFTTEGKPNIIWDNEDDFIFYGSEMLIIHVFYNLLKNAVYFIHKAGKGKIHIWVEHGEDFNKIHFKDTGFGIKKEHLNQIFDQFFTVGTNKGTGIGLAFCQLTMERIGGKISCESEFGEYTEFVLYFPAKV